MLRYYGDLSEREIAETMGIRPGTVKSLLVGWACAIAGGDRQMSENRDNEPTGRR